MINMQRKSTNLALLMSIAAFAMLTLTQWLHSPLHHLADSVAVNAHFEQSQAKDQHSCSHSHGDDPHGHHHSHDDHAAGHSHHKINDHSGHQHCPGHPHPDDECEICLFVGKSLGETQSPVCLSGNESVEFAPDPEGIILTLTTQDHFSIRGPPLV
jgi:hypothetical protein